MSDHGISISVRTDYWEEQSDPSQERFAFAYHIRIQNSGDAPAQLISRHWIITDATGKIEEVKGLGVVGNQPRLGPGETFEYTSYCLLATPHGSMHGSFQMVRDDGSNFTADIPTFVLALADSLN